jgi:hypothetical protein
MRPCLTDVFKTLYCIVLGISFCVSVPPIQWVPGAISPGIKRPGREAGHSPPSSLEVKNGEIYLHSPICLHGIVLK